MADVHYGAGAVEQVRTAVAGEARRVPALADPVAAPPTGALGGLATGGLEAALGRVAAALRTDLAAAGTRLEALDRALDATQRSMTGTDDEAARSLTSGR